MSSHVLAIDEGGTGVRAYVFDHDGREIATAYAEIGLSYPRPGWVEHDPLAIWERTLSVTRTAVEHAAIPTSALAAIGVANQRASALVWDAASGLPIYPAIGWQDLRTVARCEELGRRGYIVHPLQSATKFAWILDHVPDARARAAAGTLRLGTIDSWISWKLSGGACHVTDASNASCTGIYDFFANRWDEALLDALELPAACLPTIAPTSATCGTSDHDLLGARVPLAARAGDQQAAMFGQLCTEPGMMKITYGTAAMMDVNVGPSLRLSPHGAFPLVLWGLEDGVTFCLEGSAVTAGAAVQWLRDGLGIVHDAAESETLATSIADSGGVWCVPALQGLGTPYLDASARALIGGISRGTGRAEIARAVLEGIAFRCAEVIEALRADSPNAEIDVLRVDGGASQNDFLMQCQADVTGLVIERPVVVDAATLGAAYLAGLATGFWRDRGEVARIWRRERLFEPRTTSDERASAMAGWKKRVALARGEA
jgi:glycerol kinase